MKNLSETKMGFEQCPQAFIDHNLTKFWPLKNFFFSNFIAVFAKFFAKNLVVIFMPKKISEKNILKSCLASNLLIFLIFFSDCYANSYPTLPPITVSAKKQILSENDFTNSQLKIKKIAGGASLISSDDLQKNYSATLKDMLDYVPGIIAQSKAGQESRLSIRGSGLSRNFHLRGVNLYQDGVPINLADGSADFQDIDPLAFNHVEVFKGANGMHLGSSTLGGAINFVSPTGYNADALKFRLEGGSFGTARTNISSGKVLRKFDYFASLSTFKTDGYRQQNQQSDTKFYSNFGYRINQNTKNRTYLTLINSNLELPGSLTKSQFEANPKQANSSSLSGKNARDFNEIRIANKTSWKLDNSSFNAGFYSNLKDLDHPIFQVLDQQTQNYGIFGDGHLKNEIFSHQNETDFGVNLSYGKTNAKRFKNVGGRSTELTQKGDEKSQNGLFFVQNNLHLNQKIALIFGSQFILANRDYKDRFLSDGDQSGVRKYYGLSPKIGAIYNLEKNTEIFGNLSGAYEPPTFSEVRQTTFSGLANISAQKSYTLEIGTRRTNTDLNWDMALYRSHLRDELILYNVAPNATQAVNANKTLHQGVEIGIDTKILSNIFSQKSVTNNEKIGDKLILRATYILNDFRFINDSIYHNKTIPGATRHFIRAELKYQNSAGFYMAPNVEIVPTKFFIDSQNSLKAPNYWVLSLNAGHEFNRNFSIYLDAKNLFNKKYSPTVDVLAKPVGNGSAVYYPANSRAVYAGVKFKW